MLVRNVHVLSEKHRIQKALEQGAWEHGKWKMERNKGLGLVG